MPVGFARLNGQPLETGFRPHERAMRFSRTLDSFREYVTDSPSPERMGALLKSADQGEISDVMNLAEELEGKDAHLQGVAARRRGAVTSLDWYIEPDPRARDKASAKEAAFFVQRTFDNMQSWPETLEHISTAIGPGLAVLEMIWHRGRLVETVDVPGNRLTGEISGGPGVFIEIQENISAGIPALLPKFATYAPDCRAGFPLRVTLMRATAWLWVIKHYAIADWAAFSEQFGSPWRVASWEGVISATEREQLEAALRDLASDAYLVHNSKAEIKFVEANRGTQPFADMVDYVDAKMSILWLGQTLTTEQQSVGSLALGQVHDNTRVSIALADMQREARFIRQNIIRPMIRFRFPENPEMPIPIWTRRQVDEQNADAERVNMDKLRLAKDLGLAVADEQAYDLLGLEPPVKAG